MRGQSKRTTRETVEGAKASSIPLPGQGRLSVEQLNILTRDVVDFLRRGPPGIQINGPFEVTQEVGASPKRGNPIATSNFDRSPYKPRLESIHQALTSHLVDLQVFQSYLNPAPAEAGENATAGVPSSFDGLFENIELLLARSSDEFNKIRKLF